MSWSMIHNPSQETAKEAEANRLIRKSGARGVYTEQELIADERRHTSKDMPVEAVSQIAPTSSKEVLKACSKKQRRAMRKMRRLQNQAAVAEEMGISQPAVSRLLGRAFQQIQALFQKIDDEREPCEEIWRLWWSEQAYKRRLIYRNNTHPMKAKQCRK